MSFIVYENFVDEVIVCTSETEQDVLVSFFEEGGRDLVNYDRTVINDCGVAIHPSIRAN